MSVPNAIVVAVAPGHAGAATSALEWGAREARLRDAPLEIVCAYRGRVALNSAMAAPAIDTLRRRAAEATVRELLELPELLGLDVTATVIDGDPAAVLVGLSRHAGQIVLGARRPPSLATGVQRSITSAAVKSAHCPVVAVCGPPGEPLEGAHIVAGVDDEPSSADVLRYAFAEASWHGVPLTAILCWHPDLLATMAWRPEQPAPQRAHRWLAEALAGWSELYPDVTVTQAVVRDHVADGLTTHAAVPYLVVVGRHHRNPLERGLTGPIHHRVMRRADCPVAVVPVGIGAAQDRDVDRVGTVVVTEGWE